MILNDRSNSSSTDWVKNPYGIVLGKPFNDLMEVIDWMNKPDIQDAINSGDNEKAANIQKVLDTWYDNGKGFEQNADFYTKPNFSDSSVGGNDAINPLWQFNRDDDIVPPLSSHSDTDGALGGMGRVYGEMYDEHQQILWMTMGVPKFTSLTSFYLDACNPSMASIMNSGSVGVMAKLKSMLLETAVLAIELPWLPLMWFAKLKDQANDYTVTKYYSFHSTMTIYYRLVNGILSNLAVGMGLFPAASIAGLKTGGVNENKQLNQMYAEAGIPEVLRNGPDIFSIIDKRASRLDGSRNAYTTDQLIAAYAQDDKGVPSDPGLFEKFFYRDGWRKNKDGSKQTILANVIDSLKGSALGGGDFIGFRVENTTDSSESVSNSTGESTIAQKLNQTSSQARDTRFDVGESGALKSIVDAVTKDFKSLITSLAGATAGETVANVISGNGFYSIPEVWKSSSFTKSYSLNIQLRAKYGDPVSVFQSIYIPLACLLAAALPRAIGKNTYTSPFLIRGYCKGMFSIPCGMIESMTIRRGASEFRWTNENLPTSVDVQIQIKDLSPAFFLSLADQGFTDIFNANDGMLEYLTTLSGIGCTERHYWLFKLERKFSTALLINKNTTFSPIYWSTSFGRSNIVRTICEIIPNYRTPQN